MNSTKKQTINEVPARYHVDHPYLVMMGLYLGAFCGMFSETAMNIALPQLMAAFSIESSLAQWVVVGYMLVIGLILPFAGILMKHFRVRALTLFALVVFFAGCAVSAFAPSFGIMLAGRMAQGVGTGLVLPMTFALVLEVFPPAKIGAALGMTALVIMSAPAIGPTLSGIMIGIFGWRAIFVVLMLVLAVAIAFAVRFAVDPYELSRPALDVPSCVLSCVGFGCFVAGVSLVSMWGIGSPAVIALLVLGVAGIVVYARRQLSMESPILNLRAFSIRDFRIGSVLVMVNFGITLSAMYLMPQYLQSGMMLAVALAGVVMLPGGVVNAVVSAAAGRLYDKVGARVPALAGFALSAIGAVLLLFAQPDSSIAYIIACHLVLMVGVPLAMSPCQSSALNALPPELSGDGSTILNTMQQVWGAVCTAVATILLGAGSSSALENGAGSAAAFTTGAHWGFAFTLVLALCGFALATRLRGTRERTQEGELEPAQAAC